MFEEHPGFRLAYDCGELEIMSPSLLHDDDADFLGTLVFLLTLELGLPIKRGGSVTVRRRKGQKGIESDRCYWIANAHRIVGRPQVDLRKDPPPDLGIEVDVTSGSLDRMGIYAALRVPEVWRLEGDVLTFHVLGDNGKYHTATHSLAFPMVTPGDLLPFVLQARKSEENALARKFMQWIRKRITDDAKRPTQRKRRADPPN
jgi:Uma2 family endonuclease